MMSSRLKSNRELELGFTLVETLAALAIASVIIIFTSSLLWNVGIFFDRGTRGVSHADRLMAAVNRLAMDFGSARFAQRLSPNGESIVATFIGQSGQTDRQAKVVFVSAGNVAASFEGDDVVVLTVEPSDKLTRLVRRRTPWLGPRMVLEQIKPRDPVVLIEGNVDIRFTFGKLTPDGTLSWQDNWLQEFMLPRFVRLVVRNRETGADILAGSEFVLRSNSPQSCLQENAKANCLVESSAAAADATGGQQSQGNRNVSR
jgi:prepilin-type N-terminal cleavage/methylation domain-containing protein